MNILLIKPMDDYPFEPLGLLCLASYLRQNTDHDVRVLDLSALSAKKTAQGIPKSGSIEQTIREEFGDWQIDLAGITSMVTIYSKNLHDVARALKNIKKDLPVIVGGTHASSFPELVLQDTHIDAVVIGEGEVAFRERVDCIEKKNSIFQIRGVAARREGSIVKNIPCSFMQDIDVIPYPARDLVDMQVYLNDWYTRDHSMHSPRATVISSRGCPHNCIFCSIHSVWKHTYRTRSAGNVADEIENLYKAYGVREIAFWDDNLSFDKKRLMDLCDELIRRRINISWCTPNGVDISRLDRELLVKMKKSGCYKLTFGIESASPATRKFIRKQHIDLDKAKEIISYCNRIGLWTHSTFVIGFPYETENDITKTIDYAVTCGVDMATFYVACPYPGTELYDIYLKEGLLPEINLKTDTAWRSTIMRPEYDTKYFTAAQLIKYQSFAQKKAYISAAVSFLNPFYLMPKILGRDKFRYFIRMVRFYYMMAKNAIRAGRNQGGK